MIKDYFGGGCYGIILIFLLYNIVLDGEDIYCGFLCFFIDFKFVFFDLIYRLVIFLVVYF